MNRQVLTDETGRWFDLDSAREFQEGRFWDGRNHVSLATRSPWEHEALYRTRGGRWILHRWSQWQGTPDSWVEITKEEAARWFAVNNHEPDESILQIYEQLEIP